MKEQENIFDEFMKNKEIEQVSEETKVETNKTTDKEKTEENPITKKVDNNEEEVINEPSTLEELNAIVEETKEKEKDLTNDLIYSNPKYKEFKEKFMQDEKNNNLLIFFAQTRNQGIELFDDDFFIYNKMIFKDLKIVMMDPSDDDIALGRNARFFLVRSVTPSEYQSFINQYKSKDSHPDEFMEFIVTKGVVYPEKYKTPTSFQFEYTTGEALSLYDTIINISDLNKKYRVIEV